LELIFLETPRKKKNIGSAQKIKKKLKKLWNVTNAETEALEKNQN
jgi:hypothetical protein